MTYKMAMLIYVVFVTPLVITTYVVERKRKNDTQQNDN